MPKFDITIRESKPNAGAFIYQNVEAKSKRDAVVEMIELHRDVFNLWGEKLEATARCVREA